MTNKELQSQIELVYNKAYELVKELQLLRSNADKNLDKRTSKMLDNTEKEKQNKLFLQYSIAEQKFHQIAECQILADNICERLHSIKEIEIDIQRGVQ